MKMYLSAKGEQAIIDREGVRTKAYKDTKGIWTIGVGHTGPDVVEGLVIPLTHAYALFHIDLLWAEDAINENVTAPLTQNQFDALVSFTYNVGENAFKKSTLLRKLNAGDYEGAIREFDRWHIPPEITKRRDSEKKQFQT